MDGSCNKLQDGETIMSWWLIWCHDDWYDGMLWFDDMCNSTYLRAIGISMSGWSMSTIQYRRWWSWWWWWWGCKTIVLININITIIIIIIIIIIHINFIHITFIIIIIHIIIIIIYHLVWMIQNQTQKPAVGCSSEDYPHRPSQLQTEIRCDQK